MSFNSKFKKERRTRISVRSSVHMCTCRHYTRTSLPKQAGWNNSNHPSGHSQSWSKYITPSNKLILSPKGFFPQLYFCFFSAILSVKLKVSEFTFLHVLYCPCYTVRTVQCKFHNIIICSTHCCTVFPSQFSVEETLHFDYFFTLFVWSMSFENNCNFCQKQSFLACFEVLSSIKTLNK